MSHCITHCICGAQKTRTGLCTHCDLPPVDGTCPVGCARCRERDSHCPICHTDFGTRTASIVHEAQCRQAESQRVGLP